MVKFVTFRMSELLCSLSSKVSKLAFEADNESLPDDHSDLEIYC